MVDIIKKETYLIFYGSIKEINEKEIPLNILNHLKKIKNIKRYQESINAWFNLYLVLLKEFKIDLSQEIIRINEWNKPFIDKIHFNLSHSENMFIGIISTKECGIDIQMVKENISIDKLKKMVFNASELKYYEKCFDKYHYFYKTWVKKEAYLKRIGTGINKLSDLKNSVNSETFQIIDEFGNKYYYSYDLM